MQPRLDDFFSSSFIWALFTLFCYLLSMVSLYAIKMKRSVCIFLIEHLSCIANWNICWSNLACFYFRISSFLFDSTPVQNNYLLQLSGRCCPRTSPSRSSSWGTSSRLLPSETSPTHLPTKVHGRSSAKKVEWAWFSVGKVPARAKLLALCQFSFNSSSSHQNFVVLTFYGCYAATTALDYKKQSKQWGETYQELFWLIAQSYSIRANLRVLFAAIQTVFFPALALSGRVELFLCSYWSWRI